MAVLFALASAGSSAATKHIIQFGGTLGLVYSPSSLSVAVGDTIQWEGSFHLHPLSSTTIPAGAAPWHNDTGSVFSYEVSLPGTYNYQCDNHGTLGMVGSFDATSTDVNNGQASDLPVSSRLDQNYPNPFNPTTGIMFQTSGVSEVRLVVYDVIGREVATLVNEVKEPGTYAVQFDGSKLVSGVYFYRLQAGSFVETRKLLLLR